MKRFLALTIVAGLAVGVLLSQEDSLKDDAVETFMRAKLTHSQKVVEGLTTEDFDMIAKGAQEMSLLSQATQWQVLQTPEYIRRSGEFRRATDKLKQEAQDKDLDGSLLAYVDVTMKCVACHKYVRKVQNARLDDFQLPDVPRRAVGD